MTAQIGDKFRLNDTIYSFISADEPLNFEPKRYGITPMYISTACKRGFWCVYNITNKGIFLEDLYINSANNRYPSINNIVPIIEEADQKVEYPRFHLYQGLNIKMPYSGKMLVGNGFMVRYFRRAGYQRMWAYEVVKELVFQNGTLIKVNDKSDKAAEKRKEVKPTFIVTCKKHGGRDDN